MLARLGADVTAAEPDPQMLAGLRRAMPEVRSVPGSAEELPLPDVGVEDGLSSSRDQVMTIRDGSCRAGAPAR